WVRAGFGINVLVRIRSPRASATNFRRLTLSHLVLHLRRRGTGEQPLCFVSNEEETVMGLFTGKNLDSFETLFIDQIEDLYDAEQRLMQALPKMATAAHASTLKAAFEQHVRETQNHVSRLEQIFRSLGREPQRH